MMIKNKLLHIFFIAISIMCVFTTTQVEAKTNEYLNHQTGIASYFSDKYHGKQTASGEPYNKFDLTTTHASLPFGTILRVTNLSNNQSVDVRVNSRAHPANKRLLDLSKQAAIELGFIRAGVTKVAITVLHLG